MTIMSTICWGSFANTFKGTKNYRFELYYWDYGLGIFLISVVLAFTMGSYAGGPTAFLANLHSADGINLFYAALGGFIGYFIGRHIFKMHCSMEFSERCMRP